MESLREGFDFDTLNKQFTNLYDFYKMIREDPSINMSKFIQELPINYDSSVKIIELPKKFNELYTPFIEDLSKLEKLDLAFEIDVQDYAEDEDYRSLQLYLYGHKFEDYSNLYLYLWLWEEEGKLNANIYSSKDSCFVLSDLFNEQELELFKKYLDLFSKHKELIYIYLVLKHGDLYSNALYNNYSTSINLNVGNDWSLYDGLNEFYLYCSDASNYVKIPFKLGTEFGIDYENCKACIEDKYVKLPNQAYDEFVNSIYLNKDYIARKEYPACKSEEFFRTRTSGSH